MVKVFVSGCYDILHAGHIQFFKDAKTLGDHLTVCIASDEVLKLAKHRTSALPQPHKLEIIRNLSCVDEVFISSDLDIIFDFKTHILSGKYDILAITEDDNHKKEKELFCQENNIKFVILSKTSSIPPISTTEIRANIQEVKEVPLRIDFAGGWLDVPAFSRQGAFIVNCAIQPLVSLSFWPYEKGAGLGGSAAWSILNAKNSISSELAMGVGWQDGAIIKETGLCVWQSGKTPVLEAKYNPSWLSGVLNIVWTGKEHQSFDYTNLKRDYDKIEKASKIAAKAVHDKKLLGLCEAVAMTYQVQLDEGMKELPEYPCLAKKYLGAGHGGYALYIGGKEGLTIKPYLRC